MINETLIRHDITKLLRDLIAIPSTYPPGNTIKICKYIEKWYAQLGYRCQTLGCEEGVNNIVATIGSGGPNLVFNCHVDTVDTGPILKWKTDPFTATSDNGIIYGLGANNCKGSTAVHMWVGQEIARLGGPGNGQISFTFTGDEERLGPNGMKYLRDSASIDPDILLLGGPTENHLITEERGVMWIRIFIYGKTAHAGNPLAGDNAICRTMRLINHLDTSMGPILSKRSSGTKHSTMNIGKVSGGQNVNVVPGSCTLDIDRRLLPTEDLQQAYQEVCDHLNTSGEPQNSYETKLVTGTNGFSAPSNGPGVSALVDAIKTRTDKDPQFVDAVGVSDGRYFADKKIEIINFGPGNGSTSHAANEYIEVDQMVDAAIILQDTVKRLTGLRHSPHN